MKNILAIIFCALLLIPGVHADLVTAGGGLDATLLYYQPVPAQPGDLIDVYVQVENTGGSESKAGTITFVDSGPFKLESSTDRVKEFPSVPALENFLIATQVRVAKDADEGNNKLRVRVQENGETSYIERDLTISITGTASSLSITEAKTTPAEILPGTAAKLEIIVENVGTTEVRNVDLTLDLDDLSFAPISNSDSKTISLLKGGESYTFTFDLMSFPDAAAKAYQLPLTLEYEDETANEKEQEETVGIIVGAQPELLVYFDDMGLTKQNPQGEVVVRFVNKGLSEIKLLEMNIVEDETIEVTSESPIIYVGNIDEDDYESASFEIKADDAESVTLQVKYRDALNKEYEQEYVLPLKLKAGGENGGPGIGLWVFLIVLAGVGYWWFKKRKAKKK